MSDSNSASRLLPDWARVKLPSSKGLIKSTADDFIVREQLGFDLSGQGEHLFLQIEKRELNTQEAVGALTKHFGIHPQHIGYSGLKDKHALTEQWLSIRTKKSIAADQLVSEGLKIKQVTRHHRKLKRGSHQANTFEIVVRNISDKTAVSEAIARIDRDGAPNYFGDQRFGRGGKNLDKAMAMFSAKPAEQKKSSGRSPDRYLRGLYLSAARSFIFNQVLSARVEKKNWNQAMQGEVLMLSGSNSYFKQGAPSGKLKPDEANELAMRLAGFDIHPSSPLWGQGELATALDAFALEHAIASEEVVLCSGLAQAGLRQQRRATRLVANDMVADWMADDALKISFSLIKGCYATALLRELVTIEA